MRTFRTVMFIAATAALVAPAAAQDALPAAAGAILAHVRIPQAVLANGQPLPPGEYDVRLTSDRPTTSSGQPADDERWVEFVARGTVAGRDVAEILTANDRPAVGASAEPARNGTRVDLLKGGEFLRIAVTRGGVRYLVYLPVAPQE